MEELETLTIEGCREISADKLKEIRKMICRKYDYPSLTIVGDINDN